MNTLKGANVAGLVAQHRSVIRGQGLYPKVQTAVRQSELIRVYAKTSNKVMARLAPVRVDNLVRI